MSARVELPMFCAQCGAGFIANNLRVFTCSPACAATRNRNILLAQEARNRRNREATCVICQEAFMQRTYGQKTCGTECRATHTRRRERARYAPKVVQPSIPCTECGVMFYRVNKVQRLCSFACRQKRKADVVRENGKIPCPDCKELHRPTERRPEFCSPCHLKRYTKARGGKRGLQRPPRPCEVCKKDFRPRDVVSKLCSKTCRRKWDRIKYEKRRIAEGHTIPAPKPKVVPPPIETPSGLACASCSHWYPLVGSDLGGQCVVGRFMACKPYTPGAQPFAPKAGR